MEKEKKVPKKHFNISQEEAIMINQVREQIVDLKKAREGNVKTYEEKINALSEEKWFLEVTEPSKDDKDQSHVDYDRYVQLHEKLYAETKYGIEHYEKLVKEEKSDLEKTDMFLKMIDDHVDITTDKKGEIHYDYDKNFFTVVMGFAQVTNLGGLF